jgi:hypothetical protein
VTSADYNRNNNYHESHSFSLPSSSMFSTYERLQRESDGNDPLPKKESKQVFSALVTRFFKESTI